MGVNVCDLILVTVCHGFDVYHEAISCQDRDGKGSGEECIEPGAEDKEGKTRRKDKVKGWGLKQQGK